MQDVIVPIILGLIAATPAIITALATLVNARNTAANAEAANLELAYRRGYHDGANPTTAPV